MNLFTSLRYLVALDDHRHFGRAALACHITQPALSNALKALEQSYGTAIVVRGRSFGGFTAEGARVLDSARRILREHDVLEQELQSGTAAPRGDLVIGAVPTAMPIAARFASLLQARHSGIVPKVRSMSSAELEGRLESMALDLALGYAERQGTKRAQLRLVGQYTERYFLVRRAAAGSGSTGGSLRIGAPMRWRDAAAQPLCLLSPEMHNRTIVDRAFAAAGAAPVAAIETNSVLTLALSVLAGSVCSVMPGAMVCAVRGQTDLEALPLVEPDVAVPIAFMIPDTDRTSRTLQAALEFAQDDVWLAHAALNSGALSAHAAPDEAGPAG